MPHGIFIYYKKTFAISFSYQEIGMSQSGFYDRFSKVSVGPVSSETVEAVRKSCDGEEPLHWEGGVIHSFVISEEQKFDCTYVEWIQNHRGKVISHRAKQMIDRMSTEVSTQLVPWAAVEAVASGMLDFEMMRDFLAALCQEMQKRTDNAASKEAWAKKQDEYQNSVAEPA